MPWNEFPKSTFHHQVPIKKKAVNDMAEHPIIFTGDRPTGIIEGRITQTRRIIKPQPLKYFPEGAISQKQPPHHIWWSFIYPTKHGSDTHLYKKCPYGKVGDTLWVRETWAIYDLMMKPETFDEGKGAIWLFCGKPKIEHKDSIIYRADMKNPNRLKGGWRSPIHMFRWAARIFLEITNIRVERVQDISKEDAKAEGVIIGSSAMGHVFTAREHFKGLWDSLNAKRGYGWDKNPFVWCISFKKIEK